MTKISDDNLKNASKRNESPMLILCYGDIRRISRDSSISKYPEGGASVSVDVYAWFSLIE